MSVTRRHFFFSSLALPALAAKKAPPERPSVVLLVADNVPAWALGISGNPDIRTPNIDRLGQTGTRFRNHFAGAPAPDPGRATLLTGRTTMQLAAGSGPTLEKILSGAGYACHTADPAGAAQFLESQTADKRFFVTVNLAGPRPPYENIPQKYRDIYATVKFDNFRREPAAPTARRDKEMLADVVGGLRKYAAALTAMDAELQTVVAKLYARKLVDNTLVVFTSTCGALLGRHGLWAAGEASDPVNMYEGSVATPMIWSWPGHVPAVAVRPEMIGSCDLLPSLCDVTGAPAPAANLSGSSYLLLATGKPLPKKQRWKSTVFAQLEKTGMARADRYKLVDHGNGSGELYDLVADPVEDVNQFANQQFVTVKTDLSGQLSAWRQKYSS